MLKYQKAVFFDGIAGGVGMDMPYIFQSIDLLVKDDFCVVHEGELICNSIHKQGLSGFDTFTNSVIQESKIYSDRQFLKEVISIV